VIRCSDCGREVARDYIAHHYFAKGRQWFICYGCSPGKLELHCDGCGKAVPDADAILVRLAGRCGVFCSSRCMWGHPIWMVKQAPEVSDGGA
jgi:hypothetical protein